MTRILRWLAAAAMLCAAPGRRLAAAGDEVVVVYNASIPESRLVAEHYAVRRSVPTNQVIGLKLPATDLLDRFAFNEKLAEPLLKQLGERGLITWKTEISPVQAGRPGKVVYAAVRAGVRYLALCYGVPYRVLPEPSIDAQRDEGAPADVQPELKYNSASVDDELILLPAWGRFHLYGAVSNPFYRSTNAAQMHPTNGCFLVTRLDGPSPEIAKGLTDKALEAEREGLNGRAYFDLRGIAEGAYKLGDDWITNAAQAARRAGYETVLNNDPATFTAGFPLSQPAIYAGWYTGEADGPFALPTVEFMPGAIAYHLHSYSGAAPRDPVHNWVGPLLAKGAAVTMGCVNEPYLSLTPDVGTFLERLIEGRMTVGEAGLACRRALSWQTIVVGDPLYRPFAKGILQQERDRVSDVSVAWALIRKVNVYLEQGRSADTLTRYLVEQALSTNNAALAEKIATMYAEKSHNRDAVEWAKRALALGGTPQQRVRLWRSMAEWQSVLQPADAVASLDIFAMEFPRHPDLLAVRRRQLEIARDLGKADLEARISKEIRALESKAAPPAPPGR